MKELPSTKIFKKKKTVGHKVIIRVTFTVLNASSCEEERLKIKDVKYQTIGNKTKMSKNSRKEIIKSMLKLI